MWYVIQVMAGRETMILEKCKNLIHEKEEIFIPKIDMERRVRGIDELVTKPMFPGYIFFDTKEVDDLFYRLKKVNGLTKILRTGNDFTPITDDESEIIQRLGGADHRVIISTGYKEGDRAVITDGPLKDFSGDILRIDRRKRTAVIAVSLLGEVREIKVGLKVLNKAENESEYDRVLQA